MKVTLWSVFVVLALSDQAGASPTRFDMKSFPPPPVGPALEGISVFLLIEKEQEDASKGIEFSLIIENTGTALLSLVHEWQNVRLFLRNEQGLDVEVPDSLRHSAIICSGGPEVPASSEDLAKAVARRSLKYIDDDSPKADSEQRLGSVANRICLPSKAAGFPAKSNYPSLQEVHFCTFAPRKAVNSPGKPQSRNGSER